jgi:hypothetical protein
MWNFGRCNCSRMESGTALRRAALSLCVRRATGTFPNKVSCHRSSAGVWQCRGQPESRVALPPIQTQGRAYRVMSDKLDWYWEVLLEEELIKRGLSADTRVDAINACQPTVDGPNS